MLVCCSCLFYFLLEKLSFWLLLRHTQQQDKKAKIFFSFHFYCFNSLAIGAQRGKTFYSFKARKMKKEKWKRNRKHKINWEYLVTINIRSLLGFSSFLQFSVLHITCTAMCTLLSDEFFFCIQHNITKVTIRCYLREREGWVDKAKCNGCIIQFTCRLAI